MPDIGQRQLGEDEKLNALIVTGHTDIHHDWRTMSPMLRDLLRETGRFDVRITEEVRGAGPETLEPMVRQMYDERVATAATATERH